MFYPNFKSKTPIKAAFKFSLMAFLGFAICSNTLISNSAQANNKQTEELTRVYKVLGSDGSVSFSDTPNEKSETVMVAPIPTIPALAPGKTVYTPQQAKPEEVYDRYSSLSILAPANDSAFFSGSGDVDVILEIKPALLESDKIQIFLDGKLVKSDTQIQTRLETVYRGTHELRVKLVSSSGLVHKESTSTFTVHRPRVKN